MRLVSKFNWHTKRPILPSPPPGEVCAVDVARAHVLSNDGV